MGNIGRSSTGCYLCRKRKIKCDEGKPGCKKCASVRKSCPGYPFSVELDVRTDTPPSQTTSVSMRPAGLIHSLSGSGIPRLKSTTALHIPFADGQPEGETNSDSPPNTQLDVTKATTYKTRHTSVKLENTTSLVLRPSAVPIHQSPSVAPTYDVQHRSTCFFLNLFCWQASQIYGLPILDYLPGMLLESSPNSCLHLALKAVSRMTLADRYSGCDVRLQTGKEYVKALSATKATILSSAEAVKDETFIAVWMLGLYENVNAVLSHGRLNKQFRTPEEEYQSHISHIRGAMDLLRLRGQSQLDKGRSEKIFRIFKAAIELRIFNLDSVTSNELDFEYDVYQDDHEFIPSETGRKATSYFRLCARLLERTKLVLRKQAQAPRSTEVAKELHAVLEEAETLDISMHTWYKIADESGWDMLRIQSSTQDSMWALYPSHALYYFYNFWVFVYWLRYFIARLKLYEGMIVVVQRQKETATQSPPTLSTAAAADRKSSTNRFDFKIQRYRNIIQLVAGQIIGLTAYALGDVTNQGTFYSAATAIDPAARFREVNVIAALQLVIPLKVLQRSDCPTPTQKGAIDLALSHIGDGFRRQPGLI